MLPAGVDAFELQRFLLNAAFGVEFELSAAAASLHIPWRSDLNAWVRVIYAFDIISYGRGESRVAHPRTTVEGRRKNGEKRKSSGEKKRIQASG